MSNWTPSEDDRQQIFEEQIVPIVFPRQTTSGTPTLLLLSGQPGAGMSRATARLLAESPGDAVALSGDALQAFHPHFLALRRSRSVEAPQILAESSAGWLRSSLSHARTTGRSLLLEGTFSPAAALGMAGLFAGQGFTTRVVVVATPRPESLLSTASRYLLDVRAGRGSQLTSVSTHDDGWVGTRAVVSELESRPMVDRLTILGRDGTACFDAEGAAGIGYAGAVRALDLERHSPMPSPDAMRWLSALRAMTDYAVATERMPQPLAELLGELHEVALREVVPNLALPADSQARPALESNLARRLVELRGAVPERPRVEDLAAPVISSTQPERGISR